jgi:serine/threonine-protein kinase RsbW
MEIVIPSQPTEARRVQDEIDQLLRRHGVAERDLFGIRLAIEEALINAIKHGNQMDPAKKVAIAFHLDKERFEVRITDEGAGFDPKEVPDPTAAENLERSCGRGLMLMRHYMNEVDFNSRGNSVRLCRILRNGQKS